VASFCTKCGTALNPDTQFCTACGAPANAVVAPSYAPVPAYAPPSPAQQSSGNSAVKIILIIVGVFVGLGIIGASIFAFTVWRVARAVHIDGSGDKVSFSTPGGTFSANQAETYSAAELGTDIYPGAKSGHGSAKIDMPSGSVVTGIFVTSDSKAQVVDFYKSKFGSEASTFDSNDAAIITMNHGNQESVMVTVSANSQQDGGKTRIAIVHSKNNKPS